LSLVFNFDHDFAFAAKKKSTISDDLPLRAKNITSQHFNGLRLLSLSARLTPRMKKKLGLFLLFLAFKLSAALAQIPFGVSPSEYVTASIPNTGANEVFIYFPNLSTDSLQLTWRSVEVEMTSGWNIDLCDYGQCYIDIPSSGIMHWVAAGQDAYLKLIVQPNQIDGEAHLKFRVALTNQPSVFRDISLYISTTTSASTNHFGHEALLLAYPNPVNETVTIQTNQTSGILTLTDLFGTRIEQQMIVPEQSLYLFDLSLRQIGLYNLTQTTHFDQKTVKVVKIDATK
jgi:hypothetical protein